MKKIKIVYFAYLVPNSWQDIVIEQLDSLKKLNLYNIAANIYISVISNEEELKKLKYLLENNYNKIEIINTFNENLYEYPGIKTLYEMSDDNSLLLYFHTKGIYNKSNLSNEIRKNMFKWTIENYIDILDEFTKNEKIDIICPIPHIEGFSYFNFFWAKGSFIKKYCNIPEINKSRFYWEIWLKTGRDKKGSVVTYSPLIKNECISSSTLEEAHKMVYDIYNKYKNK